jgi:L-iditol 2-dehydrogenase
MRVARLFGIGDIRIQSEPPPVSAAEHSLVRVTAVGICGSDLHWFGEGGIGDAALTRPLVLGHECAGVIMDGPRAGTRVAIDPALPCGRCESCLEDNPNLCLAIRFAGHGDQDGGLRELMSWPTHRLHDLPDGISDAGGAVLEPLGVAIHAIDLAHLRVGSAVAIVGAGPIGLLLVQAVRAAGATAVYVVEPLSHRRQAALDRGADLAVAPADAPSIVDATGGRGVDAAIEIAGTDDAVDMAMRLARPGVRVVLAGIPDQDRTSFSASTARRKGLSIMMSRRMKEVYPRAIALARTGLVDVESLVTERFELAEANAAFASAQARRTLKTVIEIRTGTGTTGDRPQSTLDDGNDL